MRYRCYHISAVAIDYADIVSRSDLTFSTTRRTFRAFLSTVALMKTCIAFRTYKLPAFFIYLFSFYESLFKLRFAARFIIRLHFIVLIKPELCECRGTITRIVASPENRNSSLLERTPYHFSPPCAFSALFLVFLFPFFFFFHLFPFGLLFSCARARARVRTFIHGRLKRRQAASVVTPAFLVRSNFSATAATCFVVEFVLCGLRAARMVGKTRLASVERCPDKNARIAYGSEAIQIRG